MHKSFACQSFRREGSYSSIVLASGLGSVSVGLSMIESTDSSSQIDTAESRSFGANL